MDIDKLFRQIAALYLRFVFKDKRQHSKECNVSSSSLPPLFPHGDRLRLQNRPLSKVAVCVHSTYIDKIAKIAKRCPSQIAVNVAEMTAKTKRDTNKL